MQMHITLFYLIFLDGSGRGRPPSKIGRGSPPSDFYNDKNINNAMDSYML